MEKEFNLSEKIQEVTDYTPVETSDPVFGIVNRQELDTIIKEFIKRDEKAFEELIDTIEKDIDWYEEVSKEMIIDKIMEYKRKKDKLAGDKLI